MATLGLLLVFPAQAQTVTFDFDTGTPAPTPGKTTSFSYDSGGVTATFISSTANGFSVQDVNSVAGAGTLSLFSGQFLSPNSIQRAPLDIRFSRGATNISLVFATAQSTAVEIPNPITVSAYLDSISNPVGSPLTVSGVWRVGSVTEAYPSGAVRLTSDAQHPFNLIKIVLASGGAGGVMVDNISVTTVPGDHYTITTSVSPTGGGTTIGDGSYLNGATVTVSASPNADYAFVNWAENGLEVSTLSSYDFLASANRMLVANFVRTYTLTTSASPVVGGTTTGGGVYAEGSGTSISATPNPGYAFVNWRENGVPVSTHANYYVTVSTNRTLAANFTTACTITTSSSSASAGSASGGGTYAVGSTINVVATPKTGQAFVNWTENGVPVSTLASCSFTGGGDRSLVANFAPNSATVTFDFDTGAPAPTIGQATPFDQTSGSLTAHFSGTNDPAFSVQSDADTGWTLSKFSNNYLAPNVLTSVLDIQFSQPIININLTFATLDFQDILAPTTIQLEACATTTGAPPLGTVTAQGTYTPGDSMPMGAMAFNSTTPFQVVRITLVPTSQGATDFVVDNITVQTTGGPTYAIATSASPAVGGFTSGGGTVNSGSNVTIVATANAGYAFVNWTESGTPVSTLASYSFTASANRTMVAIFAPCLQILLTSANDVVISWRADSAGYVLQENTALDFGNWVGTTNTVNIVGDQNQIVISQPVGNALYRLFHP